MAYPETGVLGFDWVTGAYNALHPDAPVSSGDFSRIVAKDPTFWSTTEWFPWADQLVGFLEDGFPGQWNFLSHCTSYPECASGKFKLLLDKFGQNVAKRAIFSFGPKWVVCKPDDILIDDRERNCDEWEAAGGLAYQWREIGDRHPEAQMQLQECLRFLQDHNNV